MFTGLVERKGTLLGREARVVGSRMRFSHGFGPLELGESISVSGACLTVVDFAETEFVVDVSPETLEKTTLGELEAGSQVNLERAAAIGDRLGGHLVTGHVDATGVVSRLVRHADMTELEIEIGHNLAKYAAKKGSITIDGVSLTINDSSQDGVGLLLIPHTLQVTTLGLLAEGSRVNVEVDLVARYVERLLSAQSSE
jgi:riboflavin synthase